MPTQTYLSYQTKLSNSSNRSIDRSMNLLTQQSVSQSLLFGRWRWFKKGVNPRTASHLEKVRAESLQQFNCSVPFPFVISPSKKMQMKKNLDKTNGERKKVLKQVCYFPICKKKKKKQDQRARMSMKNREWPLKRLLNRDS